MKSFRNILSAAFAAVLLSGGQAFAADFALPSFSLSALPAAEVEVPKAFPVPAASRVYDFKSLYSSLGYPSPDYFGSSDDAVMDLETYTSKEDSYYSEINGYLRFYPQPYEWYGTSPEYAKEIVERIDSVFERVPSVPADLVLFRGLRLGWHGNKPFSAGEEFTDKAYVSTSLSLKVAEYFALEMGDEENRSAVLVIYLNRPEKGILFDQGEDEVMLGRGRTFRVMDVRKGGRYDLALVQLCDGGCDTTLREGVAGFWSGFSFAK